MSADEETLVDSLRILGEVADRMAETGHGVVTLMSGALLIEAADEIESLRALVERLREGR